MRGKGTVVKYNVPMRYAGQKVLALAYLAGRRSGLRDLAARAFFDHAIGLLGRSICNLVSEGAAPFALPVLGHAGVSDMLARMAEYPDKIKAVADALRAHPEALAVPGVCRVCGCTETNPCHSAPGQTIATCGWVDEWRTLCTFCGPTAPARRVAPGSFAARAAEGIDEVMRRKASADPATLVPSRPTAGSRQTDPTTRRHAAEMGGGPVAEAIAGVVSGVLLLDAVSRGEVDPAGLREEQTAAAVAAAEARAADRKGGR